MVKEARRAVNAHAHFGVSLPYPAADGRPHNGLTQDAFAFLDGGLGLRDLRLGPFVAGAGGAHLRREFLGRTSASAWFCKSAMNPSIT